LANSGAINFNPGNRSQVDRGAPGSADVELEVDPATKVEVVDSAGRPRHGSDPRWRLLRTGGGVVMLLCLAAAVAFSTILYHRDYLSEDFGAYSQAWTLIGQGHLNPFETIFGGYPFYKSDFELLIWPFALIHLVFPNPIVLLWLQDLAVVGTAFVVYLWIVDYLEARQFPWWPAVAVCVVVLAVLIANPGVYQTLMFDFHLEPFSTFFLVMAARDLWAGRYRRAWIWMAITLLCGTFAAITLAGLGISALLAGRATRRQGLLIIAAVGAWLLLVSAVGANAGAGLSRYAYLAGRTTLPAGTGMLVVLEGAITHPSRVIHQLNVRLNGIYVLLKPVGVIGLASAWGLGVPLVVLLTNAMNSDYEFIYQAFQNFAVFPFVLFGTVSVLVWIVQRFRFGWLPAVAIAVAVTVQALTYGATTSPNDVRFALSRVSAAQGAQLRGALAATPSDAEVVATIGIMGRFSERPYVYWFGPNSPIPIRTHTVVFVFDPAIENEIPNVSAQDDIAAATFVRDNLHAKPIAGITAFRWKAPARTRSITIPGAPSG
jgi:uncharacterized membrane protein